MNKAEYIKGIVEPLDLVTRLLGEGKYKSGSYWFCSPFRNEKVPSLIVSKKGIHDFGSSTHYDVISFVEEYYKITFLQAIDVICNMYGINLENKYETSKIVKRIEQERKQERIIREIIEKWYKDTYNLICDKYKLWEQVKSDNLRWISEYLNYTLEYFRENDNRKGKAKLYEERDTIWRSIAKY